MAVNTPLISVIVPVKNAERYLRESLCSLLRQRYPKLQVLIINDGSTDNSSLIAQSIESNFQIIELPHSKGVAAARNVGIKNARGEYITFLDADDEWGIDHLWTRIRAFEDNPLIMISQGLTSSFYLDASSNRSIITTNYVPFHLGASMFRSLVFKQIGNFNDQLLVGSDADFYLRCRNQKINIHEDRYVSLFYRKHTESITSNRQYFLHGTLAMLHSQLRNIKNA
jgi:glycosyltransferase involved in cell wall biosynthesis